MEISHLFGIAFVLRLSLVLYGEWQDRTMAVKFTDIDYFVFHDAAGFISEGKSPYERSTYRYTPLLAWLLQPNIWLSALFGKLLFVLLDCCTGLIIYNMTRKNTSKKLSLICASFWLFNPLPMAVSSRGNAESLMTCLVLLCLQCLLNGQSLLTGFVLGFAVHFKIYPVIYSLPIYLWLWKHNQEKKSRNCSDLFATLYEFLIPTIDQVCFVLAVAVTLASLTAVFYYMYGWAFLYHTYLYHVTRKDIRHNFSPYFYMLYLQSSGEDSLINGLITFIPQVVLLLSFSLKFYKEPKLAFFLNSFAFVTFNKVCTSQYFLWYLSLLPPLIPHLYRIPHTKAALLLSLWFIGQGLWLFPAYLLEFHGLNTYLYIWLAGLTFFVINCYIMHIIIVNYTSVPYKNSSFQQHPAENSGIKKSQRKAGDSSLSKKSDVKKRSVKQTSSALNVSDNDSSSGNVRVTRSKKK